MLMLMSSLLLFFLTLLNVGVQIPLGALAQLVMQPPLTQPWTLPEWDFDRKPRQDSVLEDVASLAWEFLSTATDRCHSRFRYLQQCL